MPKQGDSPKTILLTVLDEEHAEAYLDHRRVIRKPLSAYAAKLLCRKLTQFHDPNLAIEIAIEQCWQGLEIDWLHRILDKRRRTQEVFDSSLQRQFADPRTPPALTLSSVFGALADAQRKRDVH